MATPSVALRYRTRELLLYLYRLLFVTSNDQLSTPIAPCGIGLQMLRIKYGRMDGSGDMNPGQKCPRSMDRETQKGETTMATYLKRRDCIAFACMVLLIFLIGCSHKPKPSALETAKGVFAELRKGVREEIKDPARATEAEGLVDQFEQLVIEGNAARAAHESALRSLTANYDATEADFKALFREFNEKKAGRQEQIIAILQRARAITTADEWDALAKVRSHALEKSVLAEQGM